MAYSVQHQSKKAPKQFAVEEDLEPADQEMDLEQDMSGFHIQHQSKGISYQKLIKMLKSHVWSQRAQALEDFLRYLIEM